MHVGRWRMAPPTAWLSHTSVRGDTASAPTEGGFPQERFAPSVILWTEAGAGPYRRGLCPSARGGPSETEREQPRPPRRFRGDTPRHAGRPADPQPSGRLQVF